MESIRDITWDELYHFLFIRGSKKKKLSKGKINASGKYEIVERQKGFFNRIQEYFKDKEYNEDNLANFYDYLSNEKGLNNGIHNYRKLLSHIDNYLDIDIVSKIAKPEVKETHFDVLTREEALAIIETKVPYKNLIREYQNFRMFSTLYLALMELACREDELISMKWNAFKGKSIVVTMFKTGVIQEKKISPLLEQKINELPKYSHGYIFGYPDKKLYAQYAREDLKKRAEICKINKNIMLKTFRASFATQGIDDGIQRDYISQYLGHKSSQSLDKYVQRSSANLDKVRKMHSFVKFHLSDNDRYEVIRNELTKVYSEIENVSNIKLTREQKTIIQRDLSNLTNLVKDILINS